MTTTYSVVKEAVRIVTSNTEANRIYEPTNAIYKRVYDWYVNTDVTDPWVLAASALMGSYSRDMTYQDMLDAEEYWFPRNPYEEIFGEV